MRKFYLILTSFVLLSIHCMAGGPIDLSVGIIDPAPIGHKPSKAPIQPPVVYLDDYTLSFNAFEEDCAIQLLDEDDVVVFSDVITAGTTTFLLPSTLSGEYQIQLIYGNWIFIGWIEL